MDEMDQNEELFRAWIGEKKQDEYYHRMKNGGFNWVAFFLSDLLMLSRKMFLESIILIVLLFLINTVYGILGVPTVVYNITRFAIALIIGYTYYYMYRWSISRKIRKYQKQGLSYEKQMEIAKKRAGDKFTVSVIVMFCIEVILTIILGIGMIRVLNIVNNTYENNNSNSLVNNNNGTSNYFNKLTGKWYDSKKDLYMVINADGKFELYTSDMTTLNIKGTYTVEQNKDNEIGDAYIITITTNSRTISGKFYGDTYTTQYGIVTENYKEMIMMNAITYTMYELVKI